MVWVTDANLEDAQEKGRRRVRFASQTSVRTISSPGVEIVDELSEHSSLERRRSRSHSIVALSKIESFRPAFYALMCCTVEMTLAQGSLFIVGATAAEMQRDQGWGDGSGTGYQYDLLVGVWYSAVNILGTLFVGAIADHIPGKKQLLLAFCMVGFGLSTFLTGFTTSYEQVLFLRICFGLSLSFNDVCNGSILSGFFPKSARATALGIFNVGIYLGFAMAMGPVNYIKELYGWRRVYQGFGVFAIIWSIFVALIPTSPLDRLTAQIPRHRLNSVDSQRSSTSKSMVSNLLDGFKTMFTSPTFLVFCVASCLRNGSGMFWAYQVTNFYYNVRHTPGKEMAEFLGWTAPVAGATGSVLGGYLADVLAQRYALWIRVAVLVASCLLAVPFSVLVLLSPSPATFLWQLPSYAMSEMWIGICVSVVVELVPYEKKSTMLGLYFFIVRWGDCSPSLFTLIETGIGNYLKTLLILWPGGYGISGVLFLLSLGCYFIDPTIKRVDYSKVQDDEVEDSEEEPDYGSVHRTPSISMSRSKRKKSMPSPSPDDVLQATQDPNGFIRRKSQSNLLNPK